MGFKTISPVISPEFPPWGSLQIMSPKQLKSCFKEEGL